jgi:hypothetical protein
MNALANIGIRILEALFVIGVLGSAAVFAVATVEDVEVILDKDVSHESSASSDAGETAH